MFLIRIFGLVLLLSVVSSVWADDVYSWLIETRDLKLNAPIPGIKIQGTFTDKRNGNVSKQSCVSSSEGKCQFAFTASSSLFSTSEMASLVMPELDGYQPEFQYKNIKIDWNTFKIIFLLTKKSESGYTLNFYQDLFTIKDDELEVMATIDTSRAEKLLSPSKTETRFLRAFIDKSSKKPTYQIYAVISYTDSGFRSFNTATLTTPTGPVAKSVDQIDRNVDCSGSPLGEKKCAYSETLVIKIDEALMGVLASENQRQPERDWKFRIKSHSGVDLTMSMPYAEIDALVERVRQYIEKSNK